MADKLGKTKFFAKQFSKRGGEVWCELVDDRVMLRGYAVKYIDPATIFGTNSLQFPQAKN